MKLALTGGSHSGQLFDAPAGNRTHPMSERARLALFNMLGDISGLTVLDAFSGSGALAFESSSRGARNVYAVEVDPKAYEVIKENQENLGLDVHVSRANVVSWLASNKRTFDVIFCDPPYQDVNIDTIKKIAAYLRKDAIMVCSFPPFVSQDELTDTLTLLKHKRYSRANILVYQK